MSAALQKAPRYTSSAPCSLSACLIDWAPHRSHAAKHGLRISCKFSLPSLGNAGPACTSLLSCLHAGLVGLRVLASNLTDMGLSGASPDRAPLCLYFGPRLYRHLLLCNKQLRPRYNADLPRLAPRNSYLRLYASTTHCSRPWRKMSCGRSIPMNTMRLSRFSSAVHSGPKSLPINWCTPWKITLRFVPFIAKTPL